MAIRVQSKSLAGLYAELGVLAGQSQAKQREIERKERLAAQIEERKFRAWEIATQRKIREQERSEDLIYQQATKELQLKYDLVAYERSRQWDIEKMTMASQADFARREKLRLQALDELDAKKKAIRESNYLTPEEKAKAIIQVETGVDLLYPPQRGVAKKESILSEFLKGKLGGAEIAAAPESRARVWSEGKESARPAWAGTTLPEPVQQIETASDLLGQLESSKRLEQATGAINRQKPIIETKLVEEANKAAGFSKVVVQEPIYDEFGNRSKYTRPVSRWPIDALHIGDIYKLYKLNPEEMAVAKAALASGDPKIIKELIINLKNLK